MNIDAHLAYCDAYSANENAETFATSIAHANEYRADDMPADITECMDRIVAWAERDARVKRDYLLNGEV